VFRTVLLYRYYDLLQNIYVLIHSDYLAQILHLILLSIYCYVIIVKANFYSVIMQLNCNKFIN